MYTDDQNAQIVLALLKKYGIKKIVISPGMTNAPISRSVQVDSWFEVYSVVDERSAAYFATGLAYETGEPVVISCTGATASRNYLPGLTEAYYRNLPIIALTSQHHTSDYGNLMPQVTDRTISQNDIKKVSVHLPYVKDHEDYERCIISANKALIAATAHGGGPVHINLQVNSFEFTTKSLPDVRKIEYYNSDSYAHQKENLYRELKNKKIAVFIGDHKKFDPRLEARVGEFAVKFKAPVIIDHTSSYHGENSMLLSRITSMRGLMNKPDIIIDMGSITGDYNVGWLNGIEAWRLSEDGQIHDRFRNQTKLFDGREELFFEIFDKQPSGVVDYYNQLFKEIKDMTMPTLPLSNTFVAYELSKRLPKNSNLHLGILNSLRNMNFFEIDPTIDASCNVGGFGIDGPLSTLVGQSMGNRKKLYFGLVGDLAAFYDMNALGIRHIGNNLRVVLINNNSGVEFRLNSTLEPQLKEETDKFIAARGHYGSMKLWAESMGFEYMSATSKEQVLKNIDKFTSPNISEFNRPVLFEVFTETSDEQDGLNLMRTTNRDPAPSSTDNENANTLRSSSAKRMKKTKDTIKKVTPKKIKKIYRVIREREE